MTITYVELLKHQIAAGAITFSGAVKWLTSHGMRERKAITLLWEIKK